MKIFEGNPRDFITKEERVEGKINSSKNGEVLGNSLTIPMTTRGKTPHLLLYATVNSKLGGSTC